MKNGSKCGGGCGCLLRFILLASISLQIFVSVSANEPSNSKDGIKEASPSKSKNKSGLEVLYSLLGVAAIILLGIFLFKMWQKKKREEQHARLLRLFEEDDELEVELGLRD